jgi:hypothetical protein
VPEAERPVQPVSRFLISLARLIGTWLERPCHSSVGVFRSFSRNTDRTIVAVDREAFLHCSGFL